MPKYKLTWERSQNGKIFTDWTKETIVEKYREPKIREERSLLVDPMNIL
jgi:hypothetical protein